MRDVISDHAFFEHCLKDEYNKGYMDAKKELEQEPREISDTNMKMWEKIYAEEERRTTESENDNY